MIIVEITGRLIFGRRYSDGPAPAHEAKERREGNYDECQTLAPIPFQTTSGVFELSGMTGTAATEGGGSS